MSLRRRRFVQNLLVLPAAPAAIGAAQTVSTQQPQGTPQQPAPQPVTPAQQLPRQPQAPAKLKTTGADLTAETDHRYFSDTQFQTLSRLGALLLPPMKGNPGAVDASAPEFIDFLISQSPEKRQQSYKQGLDKLEAEAQSRYHKPFAQLSGDEAKPILQPLMTVRPWPEDLPQDAMQSFMAQVHEDLRTATTNSREWAAAAAKSGRIFTRGARSRGLYWAPIDPISQG